MKLTSENIVKADGFFSAALSRRDFFKKMSLLSCIFVSGCSTMRILMDVYPEKFNTDKLLIDEILRSFVVTVIPGASIDEADLTKIFYDEYYPFCSYRSFFVFDLSQRSRDLFKTEKFYELTLKQRGAVIEDALKSDGNVIRIYQGAILMAQASFYGGIYDDNKGCPYIDFHGRNSGFSNDEMYYANCSSYLAAELTKEGNYK